MAEQTEPQQPAARVFNDELNNTALRDGFKQLALAFLDIQNTTDKLNASFEALIACLKEQERDSLR